VRARSLIAILAAIGVVALLAFGLLSKGSARVGVGDQAPPIALPHLEGGGKGSLAEYRGRWVLVNFWASWCLPCIEEAPVLEEFQRRHGGERFTVLGIDSRDLSDDGSAFVRRFGLTYPQLRDGDGDAARDYGTTGVPENFLVDPRGRVRLVVLGPVTEEYLQRYVVPLLPGGQS